MGEDICFMITLYDGHQLHKVVLKVRRDRLSSDCIENYMEPENRLKIKALLPEWMYPYGEVAEITTDIFEVLDLT